LETESTAYQGDAARQRPNNAGVYKLSEIGQGAEGILILFVVSDILLKMGFPRT
jgi:hypothetical protein